MFCTTCGAEMQEDARFCPACGASAGAPGAPGTATAPPSAFTPPASVEVKIGPWIGAGWSLVKKDLGLWVVWALVMIVIMIAVAVLIPLPFVGLAIQGPLLAGAHYAFLKRMDGRMIDPGDLAQGFNFLVPSLVAGVLIAIFTSIGYILLIIPGFVVSAILMFTYLFIIDRKMDFWPAMQASHEIVKRDYVSFTLFLFVLILLQLAGAIALGVGLLFTIPIYVGAITVAYRDISGVRSSNLTL